MALRGRIQDSQATFEDPILGVNLHKAEEDLHAGESPNMKNMVHYGRLTSRRGSTQLTASQIAASKAVLGGHKYYYTDSSGDPASVRLIGYDTFVSKISDGGSETKILTGLNSVSTYVDFTTWSITDRVYITNGSGDDDLLYYDGETDVAGPAGGVNLVSSTYRWILSGSGTAEYYCELSGGGDPSIADPSSIGGVWVAGSGIIGGGTMGSLSPGQFDYGDNESPTLGFNTVYVRLSDGTDPDTKSDGYVHTMTSATVPGSTNSPPTIQTMPLVDRLFAITSNGIERSDPRDPNIWSVDSSWATFRPTKGGQFKAMIPHMVSSQEGQPIHGALAMTENAYYFFTGTYFGVDVTASTGADSVGEEAGNPAHDNSSIQWVDDIGAFHPKSVTNVPGIGTFWLTTNKNIFFVPKGQTQGRLIGNRIINTGGSSTVGLESIDLAQGADAWMVYYEPYLMVGFTIAGDTYPEYQYWLDLDKFRQAPNNPIWYGPMTGQSISVAWLENAQGDNAVLGGEGNSSTGIFVYNLQVEDTYTDAVGTADNSLACEYSTYMKSGGAPSREKVVQGIEVEMNSITGSATADVADITGTILSGLPVEKTFT